MFLSQLPYPPGRLSNNIVCVFSIEVYVYMSFGALYYVVIFLWQHFLIQRISFGTLQRSVCSAQLLTKNYQSGILVKNDPKFCNTLSEKGSRQDPLNHSSVALSWKLWHFLEMLLPLAAWATSVTVNKQCSVSLKTIYEDRHLFTYLLCFIYLNVCLKLYTQSQC